MDRLKKILKKMGRVVIAFSGGVDSTFLVKAAKDILGSKNVLAVTATSETFPRSELKDAKRLASSIGVKHMVIRTKELEDPDFKTNPPRRCYYCKSELFGKLSRIAERGGFRYVADASNYDDKKDFRPGALAAKEKKVRSPLKEARLTKDDIRRLIGDKASGDIVRRLKALGFKYVTVDLKGYRTGSMNEVLKEKR